MSLRLRLILLIVALVTVVVLVLSGLYLNSLVDSLSAGALERSELASQQVNAFITDHINRHSLEYSNPNSPKLSNTPAQSATSPSVPGANALSPGAATPSTTQNPTQPLPNATN